MREGLVFDFHRGTTHDGPGMRTTVFFKGCPLRCEWCHNPESICPERELQWDEKKCIGCGNCVKSCPVQAIKATAEGIKIQHDCCAHCYQCAQQCPSGAMGIAGEYWSAETLIKEVCKDKIFFDEFSGGVTVSGGEPILQHEFLTEFLKKLKKQDINIALDTSGFGSRENYEKIYPYVDIFLYDIKFIDKELHKKYTNVSNDIILDNLEYLAQKMRVSKDKKLWIRTPLIPKATATQENIREIGRYMKEKIADITERWELCAFNNVCKEKYKKLGKEWKYADAELLTESEVQSLTEVAREYVPELLVVSGLTRK